MLRQPALNYQNKAVALGIKIDDPVICRIRAGVFDVPVDQA